MDNRPLPETDEQRLKHALRIEQEDPLPQEAIDAYWRVNRLSRIISRSGVSDDTLVMLAMQLGGGQPELSTFIETARDLDRGAPVQALFRQEWKAGKFWGIKNNKILVCLDADAEPHREFLATEVRLPTAVELELIGA